MKKQNNKNNWADFYTKKAKKDGYPARSVYKLIEIQKKFNIIKNNNKVLDLGCAPGAWLIYAAKISGINGKAYGLDINEINIKLPKNAISYKENILNINKTPLGTIKYNVVLSDMAPLTSGRKDVDAARSFELCELALKKACDLLVLNGNFLCKIFQGKEFKQFELNVKSNFKKTTIFKPKSSRKSSKEIFIIGLGKTRGN